jgi:hypothetical protein
MTLEATDPSAASYRINDLRRVAPRVNAEQIRLGSIATVSTPNWRIKAESLWPRQRARVARVADEMQAEGKKWSIFIQTQRLAPRHANAFTTLLIRAVAVAFVRQFDRLSLRIAIQ